MSAVVDWLVVALAVAVGIAALVGGLQSDRFRQRRSEQMREWSRRHGWQYRRRDADLARVISGHAPFDSGWSRHGSDAVFSKVDGREVFAFDYKAVRSRHITNFGVLLVDTLGEVPYLSIEGRRSNAYALATSRSGNLLADFHRWRERGELLDNLGRLLHQRGGPEPPPTQFAAMYRVTADDREAERRILTPEVRSFLVKAGVPLLEPTWRFDNGLLVVILRFPWGSGDVERCTKTALELLRLIPADVFQDSGLPPGRYRIPKWRGPLGWTAGAFAPQT